MEDESLDERTGLLESYGKQQPEDQERASVASKHSFRPITGINGQDLANQVLPLALLAALAMAATAATTIFAYASLLCKIPTRCQNAERNLYAGTVAVATLIANGCGLLFLGALARLARQNHKTGLMLWFVLRSMSVVMLAVGYRFRSILVALSGQLFEGLASDNLLHYNLNAIYVQTADKEIVPRLIGTSLALYMFGISISPFAIGLLESTLVSFVIAIGLFGISIIYLMLFVEHPGAGLLAEHGSSTPSSSRQRVQAPALTGSTASALQLLKGMLSPLQLFRTYPSAVIPSLSLLLYNTGQAFIFPAIMVRTSLYFGFSAKENGYLISLAHATSAIYLFFTILVVPRVSNALSRPKPIGRDSLLATRRSRNTAAILAIFSLAIQCVSLTGLGLTKHEWQVYPIVCIFAVGLASPSFMKSHVLVPFSADEAQQAVAALTMMESMGSLLAPVFLGGVQTAWPGAEVLFVASGIIGLATVVFVTSFFIQEAKTSDVRNWDDLGEADSIT